MLRVATYNVHGGIGLDGHLDVERSLRVVEELDADLLALQEFVDLAGCDGALSQRYAVETGALALSAPTLRRDEADFGNLLLTRLPALHWRTHDLSVPGAERRVAVEATLAVGGLRIRVLAAHLGLRRRERGLQCKRLLALLARAEADCDILLGDINEWRRSAAGLRLLERAFGPMPAPRSFPSARPLFALDRIWVRPPRLLRSLDVHVSRTSRRASDHLPVLARIDLRAVPDADRTARLG